jgi:carbohydrate-selective porin OprB
VLGPDNETAIEAFYLIPINNYITLQPDIQWINNKVTPQIDSVIATLRVQFSL